MQEILSAKEARELTIAGLKRARRSQLDEIIAGIRATISSPHPKYYFVYDGYIEQEVKDILIDKGYKILPPCTMRNETITQIEW